VERRVEALECFGTEAGGAAEAAGAHEDTHCLSVGPSLRESEGLGGDDENVLAVC
jgi:hypothetical protein